MANINKCPYGYNCEKGNKCIWFVKGDKRGGCMQGYETIIYIKADDKK